MRQWKTLIPVAALAVAITLPGIRLASAQSAVAVLEGTALMVVEDDFARGKATKRYFLEQPATKARKELKLSPRQAEAFQPGSKVRAKGKLTGDTLEVEEAADGLVVVDGSATVEAAAPVTARKALILLVDITDAANVKHVVSANCDGSTDLAATATFGFNTTAPSVDGCYQDSSFGSLGVGGAAYPGTDLDVQRVNISDTVTSCNYTSWGSKADAQAQNLASYQHRVYVVPADVSCGWAGLAYISSCPGPYCQSWVKAYSGQACGYADAIGHEMAHNLGLLHASTDKNNDGTNDCEYCDDSDFMGYAEANLRPLNGPHRVQMGWLSGGQVVDASAGGQFTLSALNLRAAPLPQVARINVPNGHPYYVSYRTAIGYDSLLASTAYSAGVLNEISVHRWPGGVNNTRFVTSLADGEAFSDALNTLTIVQNSRTADGATFTVSIGLQLLQPPTNLKATAGNAQVALSWTASAGATGYNIKRAATSGGQYDIIALGISSAAFTDTAVVNGQTYYYVVSARSGTTESTNSAPVSATPNGVDLVTTAVSKPPAATTPGASFSATDTVKNQGAAAAGATTTRYYLSADAQKATGVLLTGSRSVGSLAAGQTSSGSATVTVPAAIPLGTYYLLACADDQSAVVEASETNNCVASTAAVIVARPDLVVSALTNPPTSVNRGGKFKSTLTVKNQGPVAAGSSTARFYLSTDQQKSGAVLLTGSRSVGGLAAGASSSGSVNNVTVPSSTPVGTYYLLACADDQSAVIESDEANNCRASAGTIAVR